MAQEESVGINRPWFARAYMRSTAAGGDEEYREELLAGLTGSVIEVGCGHGLNFPHYPATVEWVLAVEPEPTLRSAAREAAQRAPVEIEVVDGTAEALPAADGVFDAGIVSLVLCSVTDQGVALAELRRAIRSGGELRFYEHVASHGRVAHAVQRFADATLWPRLAGGCHMARETESAIRQAGFEIDSNRRFSFAPQRISPPIPHILGRARKP